MLQQTDSGDNDLGPDMFHFGLHKPSLLGVHIAVPVLSATIDHSTVDTLQYVPATERYLHDCTGITQHSVTTALE